MRRRAPGDIMLKMIGMLLLVLGIFMAFGGAGTLALVFKGSSDEVVRQFLAENKLTFVQMTVSGIISAVAGIIYLAAGIFGVKYSNRTDKANQCVILGVLLVVEVLVEVVYNYTLGQFQLYTIVSMMALPALYLWGAFRNKQAQGSIL
ncbi:MAG: hypothetical protein Q4D16_22635 [Eubacteriales bacterium]|nr:hypothetical protein [Eubacteriales bacterium]